MQIIITIILCSTLPCWAAVRSKDCFLSFPKTDDRLQPILLTNITSRYNFFIPTGKYLDLNLKKSLTFLCSPKGNAIQGDNKNLSTYFCYGGENFMQRGNIVPFDEISCKSPVRGSIVHTKEKCGNNIGRIINIGYQVTKTQFLTLIQSCYDSNEGNALYTNHTVYGQAIPAFSTQSYRPSFSEEGLPFDLDANNLYTQSTQKRTLAKLLRSTSLANNYYPKNQFLSRGHLSPDADFVFAAMQFTTYFYINVNPQWQTINAGNWLAIEKLVRKMAGTLKVPLQVYTGSYDVLTLPDINFNLVEIYLDYNKRIPVPKYLWKIVYNDKTKEGIAFVTLNNPFFIDSEDKICEDICGPYYHTSFEMENKGYTYCCDVRDLQRVVRTIPNIRVHGVLRT